VRTLSLGYSPCPNDTFIFYALVHKRIPLEGFSLAERLEDVETLNRMATRNALDITKISFHAFAHLRGQYALLRSGGAMGKGCGPLVVARDEAVKSDLRRRRIAIPGNLTTAFLLLRLYDVTKSEVELDIASVDESDPEQVRLFRTAQVLTDQLIYADSYLSTVILR